MSDVCLCRLRIIFEIHTCSSTVKKIDLVPENSTLTFVMSRYQYLSLITSKFIWSPEKYSQNRVFL